MHFNSDYSELYSSLLLQQFAKKYPSTTLCPFCITVSQTASVGSCSSSIVPKIINFITSFQDFTVYVIISFFPISNFSHTSFACLLWPSKKLNGIWYRTLTLNKKKISKIKFSKSSTSRLLIPNNHACITRFSSYPLVPVCSSNPCTVNPLYNGLIGRVGG